MAKDFKLKKSYNSKILLNNDRKKGFLDETFQTLEKGSKACLDLGMALLGGINMDLAIGMAETKKKEAQESAPKKKKVKNPTSKKVRKTSKPEEKKASISAELILASCLFRIIPKSNDEIVPGLLPSLYERYSGTQVNEQVKEYFSSNFDSEKYMWKDMRHEFQKLASELNVAETDLFDDVQTMVRAKFIGLKFKKIWGIVSNLFGTGKKVPKQPKIELATNCIEQIEQRNPQTEDDLAKIFLDCSKCEDAQKLYLKYFKQGSKPSEFYYADKIGSSKKIDQKKVLSKLRENLEVEVEKLKTPFGKIQKPKTLPFRSWITSDLAKNDYWRVLELQYQ